MTDTQDTPVDGNVEAEEQAISLKEFLEQTRASVEKVVKCFWVVDRNSASPRHRKMIYSDIRMYCRECGGERNFRALPFSPSVLMDIEKVNDHPVYRCGDCQKSIKEYALRVEFNYGGSARVYKYGEFPPLGIPVSNRVLRLFGQVDAALFQKGRQCESLGYGIAAFAYYRRVVENHKNELFSEIIKACRTVKAPAELVQELEDAKLENSFSASIEKIKTGLPQGLLIDGHNPLTALHSALSVGLHIESDEDCLENAQAVRLVLAELVERIALLKQENRQLSSAVQRLLAKKG